MKIEVQSYLDALLVPAEEYVRTVDGIFENLMNQEGSLTQ